MKLPVVAIASLVLVLGCSSPVSQPEAVQAPTIRSSAQMQLRRDIVSHIMTIHRALHSECLDVEPTAALVVGVQANQTKPLVVEEWTMTGCRKSYVYRVQLTAPPQGGTDIAIEIGAGNPRITPD